MKFVVLFLALCTFLLYGDPAFTVHAQEGRFAACDLCGYCQNDTPPSNWKSCKDCLYPNITSTNPLDKKTLEIDPLTNVGPPAASGRQYTMIGCIKTDVGFTKEGAASSVTQILLNIIFSIVGGIAFLYLIYGAFIILTSQTNPERLDYGKRLVFGAIVGVVFTLASVFIVNLLTSGILRIPGAGQ